MKVINAEFADASLSKLQAVVNCKKSYSEKFFSRFLNLGLIRQITVMKI